MPRQLRSSNTISAQVEALRFAQRELVRELGITRGYERELGATLVQSHALIEIDLTPEILASELACRLLIEQSTVSRLIDRLHHSGWVAINPDKDDARRKRLSLTVAGLAQVRKGHSRANNEAVAALSLLHPSDRETIVLGLQLYGKALARKRHLDSISIRPLKRADGPAIKEIILAALNEFKVVGRPNPIQDSDLDDLAKFYRAPTGAYFVAVKDKVVIGGSGIAPIGSVTGACELRKMYVARQARTFGLGYQLLERCLAAARQLGYHRCFLNTLSRMERAIALYETAGFIRCDAPLSSQEDTSGCDRWYKLELT